MIETKAAEVLRAKIFKLLLCQNLLDGNMNLQKNLCNPVVNQTVDFEADT